MPTLSRLVARTPSKMMAAGLRRTLVSEIYVLSALSSAVLTNFASAADVGVSQKRYLAHCEDHALPTFKLGAPKNATYAHKALCEFSFNQDWLRALWYDHYAGSSESGGCYSTLGSNNGLPWTDIDYEQLTSMIKSGDIQLFDVREPEEVQETGMMPGATNVPLDDVPEAFTMSPQQFEKRYGAKMPSKLDTNIIFSCLGGVRSRRALGNAHDAGFTRARHYIGGWEEYEEKMNSQGS